VIRRTRAGRLRLLVAAVVTAGVAAGAAPSPGAAADPSMIQIACSLPHDELVRIWHGTYPGRSGDVVVVPREPNFLGSSFPHSGPWDYLQRVPLLFYGPGHVPALGSVGGRATSADIAPTEGELLNFPFHPLDGHPLKEVDRLHAAPPRVIVTLVWDAGGRDVLSHWPHDWPVLRSLIPKGIWYDNAEVASSPSITPATHATIGTGDYPMHTGQVDSDFRLGDGLTRSGQLGPGLMMEPTLADLYDRAKDNKPLVGVLGTVTWHLNMASHGSMWGGGDKDIAILRINTSDEGAEGTEWNLQGKNQPYYTLPSYANDVPPVTRYTDKLDAEDGKRDGKWRQNSIAQLGAGFDTPARVPYQTAVIKKVFDREPFGRDAVPDLFFVNYKIIDHVSHVWSGSSPEMGDAIRWQDAGIRELINILNADVGKRQWVLVLTADHGAQLNPNETGAFQIPPQGLEADLNARFDDGDNVPATLKVRTSQVYMNLDELKDGGYTLDDVARFIDDYTKEQAAQDPSTVPVDERNDRVMSAAFPTTDLTRLPCLPEART
jgi:Type I phosphodiesterase / nucleotide pyrophosphatase